jgi:hypothetical protein
MEEIVTAGHKWADNIKIDRREAKRNSIMWHWVGTDRQALVSEVMKLKMERFFAACILNVTLVHAVSYQHHQHRPGRLLQRHSNADGRTVCTKVSVKREHLNHTAISHSASVATGDTLTTEEKHHSVTPKIIKLLSEKSLAIQIQ